MLVLQLDPHHTTDEVNQYLLTGHLAGQVKVRNIVDYRIGRLQEISQLFLFVL